MNFEWASIPRPSPPMGRGHFWVQFKSNNDTESYLEKHPFPFSPVDPLDSREPSSAPAKPYILHA